SVSGRRTVPDLMPTLAEMGLEDAQQTSVWEMATVIGSPPGQQPGRSALVELRVIEGTYPFYGELALEPAARLGDLLTPEQVVVAPALLERLALDVGDEVRMGGQAFRIAAVVLDEP